MDKVAVKRGLHGLGLFATTELKRGDYLFEYTGERITAEEANRRGGKYLFELNDEWTIDGSSRKNIARYVNHACKPNCYAEHDVDQDRIFFYVKRKIQPGEELTVHYGKQYFTDIIEPMGCRCATCQADT